MPGPVREVCDMNEMTSLDALYQQESDEVVMCLAPGKLVLLAPFSYRVDTNNLM